MDYIFTCKHCNEQFIVNINDFNCKILRHGVVKLTSQPISPHESKENCDILFTNNLIYGCGKPLIIIEKDNEYDVEICGYI